MAERPPSKELVPTPSHGLITSIGWIEADYSNANLIRHYDPYDNYLEYNDGETLHKLNVLDDDWDTLSELKFPWEYWPDLSRVGEEELIRVDADNKTYEFRPHNTKLRLFDDPKINHVEHQLDPQHLRGIRVVPALWRIMFKGDYPIKYLPYIDKHSREWAENMGIIPKGASDE